MVPAAHDHGHALRDAHPAHRAPVGQLERDAQARRRRERHRVPGERLVPVAGRAGEDGAVGNECHQSAVRKLRSQPLGVQVGAHVQFDCRGVRGGEGQDAVDDARQHLGQQPLRGSALDASARGWQGDLATDLRVRVPVRGVVQEHRGQFQDLLLRALDEDPAGVLPAAGPQLPGGMGEATGQEVPGRDPHLPGAQEFPRDAGVREGNAQPRERRRGVRVRLHPVQDQFHIAQPPRIPQLLVGAVAVAVQALQRAGQVVPG